MFFTLSLVKSGCILRSRAYFKSLRFSNLLLKFYTYFYPKLKIHFSRRGRTSKSIYEPWWKSHFWIFLSSFPSLRFNHPFSYILLHSWSTSFPYSLCECKVFLFPLPVSKVIFSFSNLYFLEIYFFHEIVQSKFMKCQKGKTLARNYSHWSALQPWQSAHLVTVVDVCVKTDSGSHTAAWHS